MSQRFPNRHLSPLRAAILCTIVIAAAYGGVRSWSWFEDSRVQLAAPWFGPYVDVTATPSYAFEKPTSEANKNVVLSFVVADPNSACSPSWGGSYSLEQAYQELDLDRRLVRFAQLGGEAVVSFGGQHNEELAVTCTDEGKLTKAYAAVLDRYDLSVIDFDIEGAALTDHAANARRAKVVAQLQRERAGKEKPVTVWLTLPVTPKGLTPDATAAVATMLAAGVDLAGVNIMTMDYGESKTPNQSMGQAALSALDATHRQLGVLFRQAGTELGESALWDKLGATPMIGQNDVTPEVFTLADAHVVNEYAHERGIGRLSMWSLNRDTTCGPNYDDLSRVSDSCSGIDQKDSTFAKTLGADFTGSPGQELGTVTTAEPQPDNPSDDPATSPYRIWDEVTTFEQGVRVVWHRNVYEAKWWTKGDQPDNPVLQEFETPWRLIGPVLPGEKPIPVPTVAPGTFPDWDGEVTYVRGDRVLFNSVAFEAKWWNRAESPQRAEVDPQGSAWLKLDPRDLAPELAQ